jgi:hypothetical protein
MMPERANRTFICSVLFLDIAEYSKKPVTEQIQLKDRFNALIAESIRDIAPNDRVILDAGDGVAINFLGDPEDALFVAMSLRECFAPKAGGPSGLAARIGINVGPVRLVRDLNGQPNIIGDGINVAQRVMGFAQPDRSWFRALLRSGVPYSESYTKLLNYEGSHTDKHVHEHEVYSVGQTSIRGIRSPAGARVSPRRRTRRPSQRIPPESAHWPGSPPEPWLNNRTIAWHSRAIARRIHACGGGQPSWSQRSRRGVDVTRRAQCAAQIAIPPARGHRHDVPAAQAGRKETPNYRPCGNRAGGGQSAGAEIRRG